MSAPSVGLSGLQGRIIAPGDVDYDQARQVMYGGIDRRPSLIVRAKTAGDVQKVINHARDNGIVLAVRSGGHSVAGHSTTEGGIVLDLREMNAIEIDVKARTAWAEPGTTAAQFSGAAAAHGLAVGFGDAGSVGLGGIVTGGGVGYLSRKHGLTIDSLLAAEVVTADGQRRVADASTNSDLFWAIRGGGGNFGVLTRMRFRLAELAEFTGGMMVLPATAETIGGFVRIAESAPEELSAIANIMPAPPMPFLPPEAVGQTVILAMIAYAGPPDAADRAIAPIRALAKPLADFVKPAPYPSMYPPEDPNYRPMAVSRNLFTPRVGTDEAETILHHLAQSDASLRVAQIRVLGGAAGRVPADATAYAHRAETIMINVAAFYEGAADRPRKQAWVDRFAAALAGNNTAAYVNFVGDEGAERVQGIYPGRTLERLRQIKTKYDPGNLFRLNQNILPG